jgi:hypothetical protein
VARWWCGRTTMRLLARGCANSSLNICRVSIIGILWCAARCHRRLPRPGVCFCSPLSLARPPQAAYYFNMRALMSRFLPLSLLRASLDSATGTADTLLFLPLYLCELSKIKNRACRATIDVLKLGTFSTLKNTERIIFISGH